MTGAEPPGLSKSGREHFTRIDEMKKHPVWDVEVTEDGRIFKNGRWSSISTRKDGYHVVQVGLTVAASSGNVVAVVRRVSRLILETYVGLCPDGSDCRHLNGVRDDDRLENLCWGTREEQILDQKRHGTFSPPPVCAGSKNTHYRGVMNSEAMELAIIAYTNGETSRNAADKYGISKTHLLRIFHRRGLERGLGP